MRNKAEVKLKITEFRLKIVQNENIGSQKMLNQEMGALKESNANLHYLLERLIQIFHVHAMNDFL